MTPFRSEKNTNWEGAFRVPCDDSLAGPDPSRVESRTRSQRARLAADLLAAAGDPEVKDKLLRGYSAGGKTFKIHLDGYNQLPYLLGEQPKSARKEFIYFNDDGDFVALRFENWKVVFEEQRAPGHVADLGRAVHQTARPKFFDLRRTPMSGPMSRRTPITIGSCLTVRASSLRAPGKSRSSSPPSRTFRRASEPSSFSIDQLVEKMQRSFEATQ